MMYRIVKTDYFGMPCYEVYCGSVFKAQFRTKVSALMFIESEEANNGKDS